MRISNRFFLLIAFGFLAQAAWSQALPQRPLDGPYRPGVDVQHYHFSLVLSDETDQIDGDALITIQFLSDTLTVLVLDLIATGDGETGMYVSQVQEDGELREYAHTGDKLEIRLGDSPTVDEEREYRVIYSGIPADGLIIGENRHGNRTFFGDNWPNRARHWLPTVDHPSDKATVEWTVTFPEHYRAVTNGVLLRREELENGYRRHYWRTDEKLATKIMVIGVAEFVVDNPTAGGRIESWVYPEDEEAGFDDFLNAVGIKAFFENLIARFPYEKLANVQSTTIYGGMENAGAIFYDENSITGTGSNEGLIAHEIAHQWFGNQVTETDWPHLWLSEGFATYLTHVYFEMRYGESARRQRMERDRRQIINFARNFPDRAVVDSTYQVPTELLNANSYQKGGWVLHMLRMHVGDTHFFNGLRAFYMEYQGGNADTEDFRRVMEEVSDRNLREFFDQWLYRGGVPRIVVIWSVTDETLTIDLRQIQDGDPYVVAVPLYIHMDDEETSRHVFMTDREFSLSIPLNGAVSVNVQVDADVNVLAEIIARPVE